MNRVRIFISSPGDVAAERQRALAVVEKLQEEVRDSLTLEPLLWEQEPLLATADFQSQIRSPADFDIFATIIGSRLGSPLGNQFTRSDGTLYASGTEFEFEMAVAGYHANGKPEMLFYRKTIPTNSPLMNQTEKVSSFFDKWFSSPDGLGRIGSYQNFDETDQFEELFTEQLRQLLRRFIPRPNNLPAPISSFLGRVELVHQLGTMVRQDDVRMVTLVGDRGAGKSRLALRTSRGLIPDFEDGVFLIKLASSSAPGSLPAAIATAMEIDAADSNATLDVLAGALSNKKVLLLIDGMEFAGVDPEQLETLLAASNQLTILTSNDVPLGLAEERVISVPPMGLPDNQQPTLAEIRDAEAVQLFVERAKATREDFALTAENAGDVLEICRRLGALPLAIERATSRMRSMSTSKLLRSLESIKVKDEAGKTVYLIPR
jgi:hypothetical protein